MYISLKVSGHVLPIIIHIYEHTYLLTILNEINNFFGHITVLK